MTLPRSATGWTVAVFGGMALLLGAVGLVRPAVPRLTVLPPASGPVAVVDRAVSVASTS